MRRVALALLVVGAIGIVVAVIVTRVGSDGAPARALRLATRPAVAPFGGLTETRLGVGARCLRVVVADDDAERTEGLRQRASLGAYDGMLFVFDEARDYRFTMSTVPVPLDIGFYRADGSPVARRHMTPCPRSERDCPTYGAGAPFAYALETLAQKLPGGALSSCS
jgi:uncharacterized membrane protein (UPF0127 family)